MKATKAGLAMLLWAAPMAASAAETSPPPAAPGCYEIVDPYRAGVGVILLNRCNGSTWMLSRDPLLGTDNRPNGSSTFAWHPLQTAKDPPVLFNAAPNLPALQRQNPAMTNVPGQSNVVP